MKFIRALLLVFLPTMLSSAQETAPETAFDVELLADGLDVPWDIEQADDNRVFVLQRNGIVFIVEDMQMRRDPYHIFTDIYNLGQGGLFDLSTDPAYSENFFVYITRTVKHRGAVIVRLARFRDTGSGFTEETILYDASPAGFPKNFGGRIAIDLQNKLFMTLGDRGDPPKAQNLGTLHGKIIRLNLDGTVPPDNPFVYTPGALSEIYSFGHRNPQGLAIHPLNKGVYVSEHGPAGYDAPAGGDEINRIEAGKNYGWPVIYHTEQRRGMETALKTFTPSTAPANAMFYTGTLFPAWQYSLFIANLAGMSIQRFYLDNENIVTETETLFSGIYGRIRALGTAADGSILFATSEGDRQGVEGKDRIFRIRPAQ